jgi:hypothetical protein
VIGGGPLHVTISRPYLLPATLFCFTSLLAIVCKLATSWWFSPSTPVSSTNKTDRYDIAEIFVESGVKHHNTNKGGNISQFWKKLLHF